MSAVTFVRAVLAVLAGFIGIRKRKSAEDDAGSLRPLHIIVAGICMVAAFIAILLFVVQLAIQS